ncbi:KN motif and ankyrin repeat domain-containing protein 2 isoform X2 [Fopius arisanus]|uniref:KN motif and ankyrin repeat domain-containing protein 2 isoform X2 n=1 Tax=Fopius arisanus TaxID=64838 RepID=A0A9R1SWU1_9HYME|nr:PREDICTED: KN motif and ankyrin repeat domain-containing protein 2 isoform X2 [Fopius arisanus]
MGVKNFFMKRLPFCKMKKKKYHGSSPISPIQNAAHVDRSMDFDNASIGSGNSNNSTGALQNIREQMAASLERMRELEEQVKVIPILQVQVSILKDEKRNLQCQVQELNKTRLSEENDQRLRSQSLSERYTPRNSNTTRDMGTMCGIVTRDVGVSHQQIRTRDVGMVTSTPIQPLGDPKLGKFSALRIDERDLDYRQNLSPNLNKSTKFSFSTSDTCSLSRLSRSSETSEDTSPGVYRKNSLRRGPLKVENIQPDTKQFKDSSTITDKAKLTFSVGTETKLRSKDIYTPDDLAFIVEDAINTYKEAVKKKTSTKGVQTILQTHTKKHQEVQVSEPFRMKSNVGVTAKPRTSETGTEVGPGPGTRSIATGPDPVSIQTVSLNLMNVRSHSFNYGDTKPKRKTTKSIGVSVEGLIKTTARSTDTTGLKPKTREFGTSPIKKKFVDVSVGDSLKPHIAISCAANYCDNCKETIKSLAKQMSSSTDNNYKNVENPSANVTSKIPRPSHIPLNSQDFRRQFKRQDTYTKIPIGIIRYDADNRDNYESRSNKLERLEAEENRDENNKSSTLSSPEKEGHKEEKALPDSALFEPIRDKSRVKKEPSKEMRAAMKVLNDNLRKSPSKNISHQTKNASNIIQQEWFNISSTVNANPLDVEDYLDCFEEYSSFLLEYIVNMTDSSGNTAMHYAVSHGNFDVVSILLDSKVCDINKSNVAGYTAVMLAALAEVRNSTHASVANRLFQLADVNIRAKLHGQTALMLAVSHGRRDMTHLLLEAGAAVNIQDEDGSTALMCAAEHGHTDIVRMLLSHPDCDSSITDIDGSSALKIALEAGHRDIGILLYAHEHVNRGTSPYSSIRRSRRGSKPTTPTGPSPSAPVSPAPSRRFHSANTSLTTSKYSK